MDAVYIALVAAGMGAMWWRHLRPIRARAIGSAFEPDAEISLHVAAHESRTRAQPLSSLHILYGLLQDETIMLGLRESTVDPEPLEDLVLAALDTPTRAEPTESEDAQRVYGRAAAHAHHAERRARCVDLWAYLKGTDAAVLLETHAVDHTAILFRLFHGGNDPDAADPGTSDVYVVLRNDDYTTMELVCEVLEEVFGLSPGEARVRMLETHTEGRSVIGRFRASEAREKILEVRSRARTRGAPLWIGAEPT